MDDRTTVADLKKEARAFRDARDWQQFHQPKDLAAALSIEAGELQELFLWKKPEEIEALLKTERGAGKLREELADCALFLLHLADRCGVDLSAAVRAKLAANERKYPVDKSKGTHAKYDELR